MASVGKWTDRSDWDAACVRASTLPISTRRAGTEYGHHRPSVTDDQWLIEGQPFAYLASGLAAGAVRSILHASTV